ncbi:MAG: DUF4834 family protein [Rikenellaceae bacterium]
MFNIIKDNLFLWLLLFLLIVSPSFLFGAVGVIICVVLVLILLAIVGGFILKWKLTQMGKRAGGQQYSNFGGFAQESARRESRAEQNPRVKIVVTDEQSAATDKKVSKDVGDYVEFEEIKK